MIDVKYLLTVGNIKIKYFLPVAGNTDNGDIKYLKKSKTQNYSAWKWPNFLKFDFIHTQGTLFKLSNYSWKSR